MTYIIFSARNMSIVLETIHTIFCNENFLCPKIKTKYMYSKIPEAFSESQLYTLVGHNGNNCMHILFYVSSFAFMLKQEKSSLLKHKSICIRNHSKMFYWILNTIFYSGIFNQYYIQY